jgi:DNA gyrase subunit A
MLTVTDFSPDQPTWALVSEDGLISRTPEDKAPRLWGRSAPRLAVSGNTRDTLYLVSTSGKTAAIAMHALPEAELSDQGVPIHTVSPLRESDKVMAIFSLPPENERAQDWFLMTVSRGGMVKKTALGELPGPAAQTFELARTKDGDEITWVLLTNGTDEIMLATAGGMAIRFTEEDVRPMGLVAAGVNGIKLKAGDQVVGATVLNPKFEVFLLASDGVAKRVKAAQFPTQGRYGQGVTAWKLGEGIRLVGIANDKPNAKVTLHLSKLAAKAVRLDEAPIRTRPSNGRSVVEIKTGVVAMTVPWAAPGKVLESEDKPAASKPKKPAAKAEQMQLDLDGGKKRAAKTKTKTAAKRKTTAKKAAAAKPKTKTKTKTKTAAKPKTKPKAETKTKAKTKTSSSARKKTSTRGKTSTKK